jgi:2-polyprenyl-3-methyl-5-hydroxy-6-metoxy-1,4-benzoquinol methylase
MKIKEIFKNIKRGIYQRLFPNESDLTQDSESISAEISSIPDQQLLMTAQIRYLLDQVSELRSIMRYLTVESPNFQRYIEETRDSFDYQWKNLSEGVNLVSDKNFREQSVSLLEQYTDLPREWFQGKKVLDAGCGNGRWSWTLCKCGAKVTAVDVSLSSVEETTKLCSEFSGFQVHQHDIIQKINMPTAFDMVFSYGVVHHTGNTFQAVKNLTECVKPGGRLFLMVYGEPRPDHLEDYIEINQYEFLRRKLSSMDFDERVDFLTAEKGEQYIHGWFDASSPRINDLFRIDEISAWLRALGFYDIRLTIPNRNLHLIATRAK